MSTDVGFIGGKFLPLHQGHVHAILEAANQCDELYIILSHSEKRDRWLSEGSAINYIGPAIRKRWLSILAQDIPHAQVISLEDDCTNDEDYDWDEGARQIKELIGKPISKIFSSEEVYSPYFAKNYPDAEHILIDYAREEFPISATDIRRDGAFAHWEQLPSIVRPYFVKKVVVVGTESCGKSTMVRQLARHYNTSFVEEYGRTRCEEVGSCDGTFSIEDYVQIAYRQKIAEEEAVKQANKLLFVDTESIVTSYYLALYEGEQSKILDAISAEQDYALWIFLEPDVSWFDDGLRMHGNDKVREDNNHALKAELDRHHIAYTSIGGNYHERFEQAITLCDRILGGNR